MKIYIFRFINLNNLFIIIMDKKSNKRIKIVNENCKINKTNQSISSSKVMKNYEILPFQNKIIKFNIQVI